MRLIDKIIIHYSETPSTMDIGVKEIRAWHKQRGFRDVGYHYIIRKDGTIEKGRDIDDVGAHCLGQNNHSIGICYVGGEDEADDRTLHQIDSLNVLVASLRNVIIPEPSVHGHNEFSDKKCPGFNVANEF